MYHKLCTEKAERNGNGVTTKRASRIMGELTNAEARPRRTRGLSGVWGYLRRIMGTQIEPESRDGGQTRFKRVMLSRLPPTLPSVVFQHFDKQNN